MPNNPFKVVQNVAVQDLDAAAAVVQNAINALHLLKENPLVPIESVCMLKNILDNEISKHIYEYNKKVFQENDFSELEQFSVKKSLLKKSFIRLSSKIDTAENEYNHLLNNECMAKYGKPFNIAKKGIEKPLMALNLIRTDLADLVAGSIEQHALNLLKV